MNTDKYQKSECGKICSKVVFHKPSLLDSFEIISSDQCFIRLFTTVSSYNICPPAYWLCLYKFISNLDCLSSIVAGYSQLLSVAAAFSLCCNSCTFRRGVCISHLHSLLNKQFSTIYPSLRSFFCPCMSYATSVDFIPSLLTPILSPSTYSNILPWCCFVFSAGGKRTSSAWFSLVAIDLVTVSGTCLCACIPPVAQVSMPSEAVRTSYHLLLQRF